MRRLLSMSKLILPWVANKTSFPGESCVWNAFYQEEAAEGVDCLGDILSQSRWGPRPMTEQQAIWEQQENLWGHSPRSHYEFWFHSAEYVRVKVVKCWKQSVAKKTFQCGMHIDWNGIRIRIIILKIVNVWNGNYFKVAIIIFSTWRENIFNSTTTKRR